jgi:hypothetical protein
MKSFVSVCKGTPNKPSFLAPILTQLRLWDSHTGTPYNRLSLQSSTGQVSIIHHSLTLAITPIEQICVLICNRGCRKVSPYLHSTEELNCFSYSQGADIIHKLCIY